MSIEAAKAFIDLVGNDEDLHKELMACGSEKERLALAQSRGYAFTQQEVQQCLKSELSDAELDQVIGAGNLACGMSMHGR